MVDGNKEYANQGNVTALFLKILLSEPSGPTKKLVLITCLIVSHVQLALESTKDALGFSR